MANDPRIGQWNDDGPHDWPETSISGDASYRRPATTVSLGSNYFVVVDVATSQVADEIDTLRSKVGGSSRRTTRKSSQTAKDNDSDDESKSESEDA